MANTGTLNIRGVSPVRRRATGASGPFVPTKIEQFFWGFADSAGNTLNTWAKHAVQEMWSDEKIEV